MCESSPDAGAQKLALTPTTFCETNHPDSAIVIPCHSSENRRYIPMGYIDSTFVVTNAVQIILDASLYHFGILTSNVHMAWMRAVCGRLEMRYCYSKDIVYNNFPWPSPTDAQKAAIERTAQAILDVRALYPIAPSPTSTMKSPCPWSCAAPTRPTTRPSCRPMASGAS